MSAKKPQRTCDVCGKPFPERHFLGHRLDHLPDTADRWMNPSDQEEYEQRWRVRQ